MQSDVSFTKTSAECRIPSVRPHLSRSLASLLPQTAPQTRLALSHDPGFIAQLGG